MPDATSCLTTPATTEIGLILTRILVKIRPNYGHDSSWSVSGQCTPGLVADVRIVDTPDASSCSKTPRKGSTREADFNKNKRKAYRVLVIVLANKLMENEVDFEGLNENINFFLECRRSEVAIASKTITDSERMHKYLSELIEKHKQVHKENLDDITQILEDGK